MGRAVEKSHAGRTPAGLKQGALGKAGCEQLPPIPYCSILKTEYPTLHAQLSILLLL